MPFVKGIGIPELLIILFIVVLIFGVGKLPQVGEAMGKAVSQFRKSQESSLEGESADEEKAKTSKSI